MANVAFLLEPFPIRNSLGSHAWIGERICTMLLAEGCNLARGDMRVICNEPIMSHLVGVLPAARPYLLQPATSAQVKFQALIADWHSRGIGVWTAIQAGSAEHEPLYEAVLHSVKSAYPFDVLAYWGTNETLRAVAARLSVPTLWAEYGPLRPPFETRFCLDKRGVNGSASGRDMLEHEDDANPSVIPAVALEIAIGKTSAYETTMTLPPCHMEAQFSTLMRFVKGRSRVILLVMQLADDANLLFFGNGWTSCTMVEVVMKAHSKPNTVFILRPHPGEAQTFHNYAAGEAVRLLVKDCSDVLVFDAAGSDAYLACLSVASEVICINSSVGFEAGLLGKPVRVLGEASYQPPRNGNFRDSIPRPNRLTEASVRMLLENHYIPEDRFWTLAFWRDVASAIPLKPTDYHGLLPQLPIATAKVLGRVEDTGDGLLFVEGIGTLSVHSAPCEGQVDAVVLETGDVNRHLSVHGWAADPETGAMVAGFVITTGEHSVWCSVAAHRPDVALHHNDSAKLATGFAMRIAHSDLPASRYKPIHVLAVTAAGRCCRVYPGWAANPTTSEFEAV